MSKDIHWTGLDAVILLHSGNQMLKINQIHRFSIWSLETVNNWKQLCNSLKMSVHLNENLSAIACLINKITSIINQFQRIFWRLSGEKWDYTVSHPQLHLVDLFFTPLNKLRGGKSFLFPCFNYCCGTCNSQARTNAHWVQNHRQQKQHDWNTSCSSEQAWLCFILSAL